jgi:hypothetical protein
MLCLNRIWIDLNINQISIWILKENLFKNGKPHYSPRPQSGLGPPWPSRPKTKVFGGPSHCDASAHSHGGRARNLVQHLPTHGQRKFDKTWGKTIYGARPTCLYIGSSTGRSVWGFSPASGSVWREKVVATRKKWLGVDKDSAVKLLSCKGML